MKKIKIVACMLVALLTVQGVIAQTRSKSVEVTDSETIVTIVKRTPHFSPKHDIRFGIGSVSLPALYLLDSGSWHEDYISSNYFYNQMTNADYYDSARYFVGNYSLGYTYHAKSWLQYGGTLVFGASTRSRYSSTTGEKVKNLNLYSLAIMPTLRLNWFYREKIQLYSSISAALITDFDSVFAWYDVTLVGCSFGRKVFGFVEGGLGMSGWGRVGLGYRFNTIKK